MESVAMNSFKDSPDTMVITLKEILEFRLEQSMSRRGECWVNAPQESFFGHFKDLADIKSCETLKELKKEIKAAITTITTDTNGI
jgi:hypothetical protein